MSSTSRASALLLLGLVACASEPPQRDVFLPPYAEKGCWARLYGEPHYAGPVRQLEGPTFVEALDSTAVVVPDIQSTSPQPLFAEVASVVVGSRARLVGYAAPLFRRQDLELAPGSALPDVSQVAFYEKVRSFTLECEASG